MTYAVELTIDNEEFEEKKYRSKISPIKNRRCKWDEVCYDYALKKLAKARGEYIWCCENGFNFLDEFFNQINIEDAKAGDIITYHEINDFKSKYEKPCGGNCMHFGIITKTDGTIEGTTIESKWGEEKVYKTKIADVADIYGNAVVIWKI